AKAAMRSRETTLALAELIEHVRKKCRLDAGASVFHGEHRFVASGQERDGDSPLARRELNGVGQQVCDDLLQAREIPRNRERRQLFAKFKVFPLDGLAYEFIG